MINQFERRAYLFFKIVNSVLEDCFQLISLLFLTIGRKNEAPAV